MIGLAMYWDVHPGVDEIAGGSKRWLSMVVFAMKAFGATDLFIIGHPEIEHGYDIQHTEHSDLESVFATCPASDLVALVGKTPPDITPIALHNYVHPTGNTLYIIGGDYGDIEFEKLKGLNVDYVHIANEAGVNNLWANAVANIVLYDRWMKWQ